jgi:microcystin-dependent protein
MSTSASSRMGSPVRPRRPVLAEASPPLERGTFIKKVLGVLTGGLAFGAFARRAYAAPQSASPYVGEIMLMAGDFAPVGWALCNGQLLQISDYNNLFTVIGTTYGGDGQQTFAVPDLRGSVPIHKGSGAGLTNRAVGQKSGEEAILLTPDQLSQHSHAAIGEAGNGSSAVPTGLNPARDAAGALHYGIGADATMAADALAMQGSSQPHNNMQPYLVVNFCISLFGTYPNPT